MKSLIIVIVVKFKISLNDYIYLNVNFNFVWMVPTEKKFRQNFEHEMNVVDATTLQTFCFGTNEFSESYLTERKGQQNKTRNFCSSNSEWKRKVRMSLGGIRESLQRDWGVSWSPRGGV